MNTLKYKNYIGSVAFSEDDKIFYGKIEGIDDLVTYEGESITELKNAFHDAVEHYLEFCRDYCKIPQESYSNSQCQDKPLSSLPRSFLYETPTL